MTKDARILIKILLGVHEQRILATRPGPDRDLLIAQYKAAALTLKNAGRRRKQGARPLRGNAGSLAAGTPSAHGSCVEQAECCKIPV